MGILSKLELESSAGDLRKISRRLAWTLRWNAQRGFGSLNKRLIDNYLSRPGVHKIQIGCGENELDGWLNTNLYPRKKSVLHLDAGMPLPFQDHQFDYIFSEHMIGHLSHVECDVMFKECRRIIKPGGIIRISIGSLPFLVGLYNEDKTPVQKAYLEWATDNNFKHRPPALSDTYVINNMMNVWGDMFFFDEKTLRANFERAGFSGIRTVHLQTSQHEHLQNVEFVDGMPREFLELESLIMEATA